MTRAAHRILFPMLASGVAWALGSCASRAAPVAPAHVEDAGPLAAADAAPPPAPTWPKEVDLTLTAPDAFHLVRSKDNDALVTVTGMTELVDPRTGHQVRASTSYLARIDLRTGCMTETYDFPTMGRAAATGSVRAALEVLASPTMTAEVEHARAISLAFGRGAAPIAISADGKSAVLEANNQIYWAKDGKSTWTRLGDRVGRTPVLTADGAHVVVNLGAGSYRPHVIDLATGKLHAISGKRSNEMAAGDLHALADGAALAVETNSIKRSPTRICITRIDTQHYVEKELVCVPANVISASLSEISADERYLALMVENPQHNRVTVYDTSTWQKVTDVDGDPTHRDVDPNGRVAWDDGNGALLLAHGSTTDTLKLPAPEPGAPHSGFVGFVGDKIVVGHPAMERFESTRPLKTLADLAPCGYLSVVDAPDPK